MTVFDLHPEELLERAARGVASAAELTRLELHLAECEVCRVEQALAVQAALDAAPLRDEELIVARLKRDVAARWAAPATRRSRSKGALVTTLLLAASLASVAAAATVVIVRRAAVPQGLHVTAPPPDPAPAKPRLSPPVAIATPEPTTEPAPPKGASESDSELPKPVLAEPSSAAELFSRANQARREGKVKEAARLYRALQERFAGSSEELVSRVTLGRLLLDRLGDSRGALLQFNSYLASPGGRALREEAMVGRALALGRIGHATEERAAWKALLDAWPKSTQAKRAAARLAELEGADDAAGAVRAPASGSASNRAR